MRRTLGLARGIVNLFSAYVRRGTRKLGLLIYRVSASLHIAALDGGKMDWNRSATFALLFALLLVLPLACEEDKYFESIA